MMSQRWSIISQQCTQMSSAPSDESAASNNESIVAFIESTMGSGEPAVPNYEGYIESAMG